MKKTLSAKKALFGTALVACLLSTGMTVAAGKPDPSVKYRHHSMETIKDGVGATMAIFKGNEDAKYLQIQADAIAANAAAFEYAAHKKVAGGDTLPAAWENWDDFASKMAKFTSDAKAFAVKPDGNSFKAMMKNCKACHDDYRKEE